MAMDPAQVKQITDALERTYQSLRKAVVGLSTLVQTGRATCDEVKAYNLWALAVYNAQRGMLTTLRAAGEPNVPSVPAAPTLFVWKGITGANAWKIDCGKPVSGLADAMHRALQGPGPEPVYLSNDQIQIYTEDPQALNPSAAPSLASLVPHPTNGLGLAPLIWLIIIAGATYAVTQAIGALAAWLTENSIQVETSNRMETSARAYEQYISARATCMSACLASGSTSTACADQCEKLIPKPSLVVDAARAPASLGFWATVGIVTVAVVGGALAYSKYHRPHVAV